VKVRPFPGHFLAVSSYQRITTMRTLVISLLVAAVAAVGMGGPSPGEAEHRQQTLDAGERSSVRFTEAESESKTAVEASAAEEVDASLSRRDAEELGESFSDKLCTMCKTSLGTWISNPVPASLAKSCDSYASNAKDFTACKMVWTARYGAVQRMRNDGCKASTGVLTKPCLNVQVICSALKIYPGAGNPQTDEVYCSNVPGYENPFNGKVSVNAS
jgi:hypothetical protein